MFFSTEIRRTINTTTSPRTGSNEMNSVVAKNALQILAQEHNRNDQSRPVPPDQRTLGAFIHVGKTGGSTLCFYLRYACISSAFRKGNCHAKAHNETTATPVSNLTTYFHVPDFTNICVWH
jgi:hypothetical protein